MKKCWVKTFHSVACDHFRSICIREEPSLNRTSKKARPAWLVEVCSRQTYLHTSLTKSEVYPVTAGSIRDRNSSCGGGDVTYHVCILAWCLQKSTGSLQRQSPVHLDRRMALSERRHRYEPSHTGEGWEDEDLKSAKWDGGPGGLEGLSGVASNSIFFLTRPAPFTFPLYQSSFPKT